MTTRCTEPAAEGGAAGGARAGVGLGAAIGGTAVAGGAGLTAATAGLGSGRAAGLAGGGAAGAAGGAGAGAAFGAAGAGTAAFLGAGSSAGGGLLQAAPIWCGHDGARRPVTLRAGMRCCLIAARPWAAARGRVAPPARRPARGARLVAAAAPGGRPASFPPPPLDDGLLQAFQATQTAAPRVPLDVEARTLAAHARTAVLSTTASTGAPAGSVVQVAADDAGRPLAALSSLSAHTRELAAEPRCALTLLAPGFSSMADSRVTLSCVAEKLDGAEAAAAREIYMAAHPDAFWADFGDFSWHRLTVAGARVVAGFGRAGSVSAAEYAAAAVDPVAGFSAPVCGHMNDDHADAIAGMAAAATGLPIASARMLRVDRLGFDAALYVPGAGALRARVPFEPPADDRKALKERLVEMTRAAAKRAGEEK